MIVVLAALLFLTLFPLYFMLVSSVKTNFQLQTNYFGFPAEPHFEFYADTFAKIKTYMINSMFISGMSAVGVCLIACLSAFMFARYRFPGKPLLYGVLVAFLMIPGILTLVPQFVLVKDLGLINTPWAAILPYIAVGQLVTIIVLRTFIEEIPSELFESIRIDGGSEARAFFHIALPFSKQIILSMALINVLTTWNDFFWPLLVLPDQERMTVTVGLYRFMDQQQILYGQVFSGMTLSSIPLMLLFGFTMKYFVQGMTSGAIKA